MTVSVVADETFGLKGVFRMLVVGQLPQWTIGLGLKFLWMLTMSVSGITALSVPWILSWLTLVTLLWNVVLVRVQILQACLNRPKLPTQVEFRHIRTAVKMLVSESFRRPVCMWLMSMLSRGMPFREEATMVLGLKFRLVVKWVSRVPIRALSLLQLSLV